MEERTRSCQYEMRQQDVDALILTTSTNLLYLTEFTDEPSERCLLCFVPSEGDPVFLAPEMYQHHIGNSSWINSIVTWDDKTGPDPAIEQILALSQFSEINHVLIDDTMHVRHLLILQKFLDDVELTPASTVLDTIRITKDATELDALGRAANLTDAVSSKVRSMGKRVIGMTERDLGHEIEDFLIKRGASHVAFDTIVGSGPNGAHPHHRTSDRVINPSEPVVLDFGGVVDGYPGDQTRTIIFAGDPPQKFEEAHRCVVDALSSGVEAVEPGIEAQEIDRVVRDVVADYGFEKYFTHRTGHGVGLDVHEPPYLVSGNDRQLEQGMVFSIEPGVYFEGEFGVRVEDLVMVTDSGCQRLNNSPRTWEPL